MTYILPSDYATFGLDDTTPAALVAAASALIEAHCNRRTLAVAEYTERLRISPANTVPLTYLPLMCDVPATNDPPADTDTPSTTPFTSVRLRYGSNNAISNDLALSVSQAFALTGAWTAIDPTSLDFDKQTGEITLPINVLGLPYAEAEFTYRAGFSAIPDAIKIACASITQNALATPALNVRASSIERMHMEYFADSLLTPDIRKLLAPFVARRIG
jgi:hypothetical protein